jgi:hypothetical protein
MTIIIGIAMDHVKAYTVCLLSWVDGPHGTVDSRIVVKNMMSFLNPLSSLSQKECHDRIGVLPRTLA